MAGSTPEGGFVTERLLYLIRHGESDRASKEWFGSPRGAQWDPSLSTKGREQSELLARRLLVMDLEPYAIYASPLRRARETAEMFAGKVGREITMEDGLIEAHIGGWEGRSFEEIVEHDPGIVYALRHQQAIWSRAPGAEHELDFRTRVHDALEGILERHPDENVLVFAHGGVVNAFCGEILGLPQAMLFLPENSSINTIDVDGDMRRIRFLNDVLHLTDPGFFEEPRSESRAGT